MVVLTLTEKQYEALQVLEEENGSLKKTARKLGIEMSSLGNRIERIRSKAMIDPLDAADRRRLLEKIRKQTAERRATEGERPFKKCDRPCKYRALDGSPWGCDYISITGQSRGCPSGEECTKFEPGERKQVLMDEWRVPKGTSQLDDVDSYVRKRQRQHRMYLAEKSKQ